MRWEHLTVPDFARAVKDCGRVGVIPIGVLEPHASHLPLGQDVLTIHWASCQAAEREPAIVLPPHPWGINHEAYHLPGAIVLRRDLVLDLLENICDEMGRNGLTKIIIANGHGGNTHMLSLFIQTLVEKDRPYAAYMVRVPYFGPKASEMLETKELGHACEGETSAALHIFPELVKMDDVPAEPFTNLKRSQSLQDNHVYSQVDWYSMYPTMYVGDAGKATAEKGKAIMDDLVAGLANAIRAVKNDEVAPGLLREFIRAKESPRSAY